jgi:hypothetical protein
VELALDFGADKDKGRFAAEAVQCLDTVSQHTLTDFQLFEQHAEVMAKL